MKIDSKAMTISLPEEKILKNQIEMSETLLEPWYIHFGIDTGSESLNLHSSSSSPCKV